MADRKNFNTDAVPRGTKVFPQAVIANGFIFLSGTVGFSPATGKLISGGFEEQVVQAFANVKTILEAAGGGLDKVVKTSMFMVSGCDPDFSIVNKIYADVFGEEAPARSSPQLMPFPGGILFSVECIALV